MDDDVGGEHDYEKVIMGGDSDDDDEIYKIPRNVVSCSCSTPLIILLHAPDQKKTTYIQDFFFKATFTLSPLKGCLSTLVQSHELCPVNHAYMAD